LWAGRFDKIMATKKRHSPEQIVRKLMTADRLLAEGKDTAAVCRELGVSEATYHRWRNQFGGLPPTQRAACHGLLGRLSVRSLTASAAVSDADHTAVCLAKRSLHF
jgi:transposase-like protein